MLRRFAALFFALDLAVVAASAQVAPLQTNQGGTGTTNPGLVAGTNITITGTWPNQTITSTGSGSGTVNSGTSGQVGVFLSTGTAISGESLSTLLDNSLGATQGSVIYRNSTTWTLLTPGTSGYFLETQGSAANPTWAPASGGTGCNTGGTAGNMLTSNGSGGCTTDTNTSLVNGALALGSSGVVGSVQMGNATSGLLTLQPATGALGSSVVSIPAGTDTVVTLTATQTLTNKTISGSSNTISNIALTGLATQASNTVLGNATVGSASPSALTMTLCSAATNAVSWTAGSGFGCNTAINAATLGGANFASPGAIGGSTPGSGAFSSLSDSALASAGLVTNTSGGVLGTVGYASASDVQTGTDSVKPVTASVLSGSAAFQTLTFGTTVNWNMQSGYNAKLTLTASTGTVAAPTNIVAGQTYALLLAQDATGSRTVTWASAFDWGTAGTPTLTTTASKTDIISCIATATAGTAAANNLYCAINKGF